MRVLTGDWHTEGVLRIFTDYMNKDFPVAFPSFTFGKTNAKSGSGTRSISHNGV